MSNIIRGRVSKAAVDQLQPGETLRDTDLKGFGARRQHGSTSYFLQKKVNGRVRWITIGTHGSPWTPETARREASRLMLAFAAGQDPEAEKRRKRAEQTIGGIWEEFLADHAARVKRRTLVEYERLFRKFILPKLGRRGLGDLTRGDVASFHSGLKATPSQANFALSALSALYTWAEDRQLIPANTHPCRRVTRFKHRNMERFLTADELHRLGKTLNEMDADGTAPRFAIAAIRLLVLTGARRSEIVELQWQYVDLPRRRLILPDSKTGQKTIFLNEGAIALLTDLPRLKNNPHVFPGRAFGSCLTNIHSAWVQVKTRAGLVDVRLHDLRHSFASVAVDAGGSLPMIGKLLGHSQPRTTARYAHLTDATVHELNQRVGDLITEAMGAGRSEGTKGRE